MKIHSWTDYASGHEKLIFTMSAEDGGHREVLNPLTGRGVHLEIGARVPEEFIVKLPWQLAPGIKKALAEWLSGQDIRPADESRAEGKLEATRYHLEDLREILKLHHPHGKTAK